MGNVNNQKRRRHTTGAKILLAVYILALVAAIAGVRGWSEYHASMLHSYEQETANTNQQFESLSRGDK